MKMFIILVVFLCGCSCPPQTPQERFRADPDSYIEAINYLIERHHREVAMEPFLSEEPFILSDQEIDDADRLGRIVELDDAIMGVSK